MNKLEEFTINRYYGLDALRAIMMLLGIVIHVAAVYTSLDIFPRPIKDIQTNIVYDFIVLFVHAFRMPVFFVLSGFFMALLYEKKGFEETIRNRRDRILFPFLAAMLLISPMVKILFMHYGKGLEWGQIWESVSSFRIFIGLRMGHLWFLYYLMFIYLMIHFLKWMKPRWAVYLYMQVKKAIFIETRHVYKTILLFTVLSAAFIMLQGQGMIDTSFDYIPDGLILGTYIVYFVFGYMLFSLREHFSTIFAAWKIYLALGLMVSFVYFLTMLYTLKHEGFMWVTSFLCSLLSWLMVFGLFGWFLDKFSQESKSLSLMAKSSYWVYLMHLPITIFLGGYLLDYSFPHYVKAILNMTITYCSLMLMYKLFVERTFIGQFLNGKK